MQSPSLKFTLINAALMAAAMGFILSAYFSVLAFGLTATMLHHWPRAFLSAWPVAFAVVMVIGRPIRALSTRLAGEQRR